MGGELAEGEKFVFVADSEQGEETWGGWSEHEGGLHDTSVAQQQVVGGHRQ